MAADRIRQVNELLKKNIGEIIAREIELPLDVFITITKVETARDLKHAKVFVTVLPDNKRVSTIRLIERRTGLVHRLLFKRLQIKFIPTIRFVFDEGAIKAQQIYDAMDRASSEE